jgi:hypothetical protein
MKVKPILWEPHPSKNTGYYGHVAGRECMFYVYRPTSGWRKSPASWEVYEYFSGGNSLKVGEQWPGKFKTLHAAKRAANDFWRKHVLSQLATRH